MYFSCSDMRSAWLCQWPIWQRQVLRQTSCRRWKSHGNLNWSVHQTLEATECEIAKKLNWSVHQAEKLRNHTSSTIDYPPDREWGGPSLRKTKRGERFSRTAVERCAVYSHRIREQVILHWSDLLKLLGPYICLDAMIKSRYYLDTTPCHGNCKPKNPRESSQAKEQKMLRWSRYRILKMVVSNFLELFFSDEVLFLNFEKGFVKCSEAFFFRWGSWILRTSWR